MALDIAQFTDRDKFLSRAAEARQAIRALPPLDPAEPVRAPGDRGWSLQQDRREQGIPLHRADIEVLTRCARKLKLETPWAVSG